MGRKRLTVMPVSNTNLTGMKMSTLRPKKKPFNSGMVCDRYVLSSLEKAWTSSTLLTKKGKPLHNAPRTIPGSTSLDGLQKLSSSPCQLSLAGDVLQIYSAYTKAPPGHHSRFASGARR